MLTLRDYQIGISTRGAAIVRDHGMLYLSMEVRTGKTLTAMAVAQTYGASHVLFCTKKKAVSSIIADYEAMAFGFELEVVNYESLHKVTTWGKIDFFICDEAHCLGAFPKPSVRTQELKKYVRDKPVVFLSGTPTPESWSQIFHQFYISQRSPFQERNFYSWAHDYTRKKTRYFYNREIPDYSDAIIEKVREKCDHLFLSYTQEQAGFSELVSEEIITVQMLPATYNAIDILKKEKVLTGRVGDMVIADTAAKMMQKIHQMSSGTVIIDNLVKAFKIFDYSKIEAIQSQFAGKKIAIFYKFIAEGAMIREKFGTRIVETPEEFNAGGVDAMYVSQVQSGREGINLSSADALVMFNIDFSAVSYWQSRARMQSKDRTREAKVYWLFSRGGIEEKIYERVLLKKDYTLAHFYKDFGIRYTDGKR
jgi:predicted RNA-binding protein